LPGTSIAVSAASRSFAANSVLPSTDSANCSGSSPDGRSVITLPVVRSTICTALASLAQT